jgi:hypothetical protein
VNPSHVHLGLLLLALAVGCSAPDGEDALPEAGLHGSLAVMPADLEPAAATLLVTAPGSTILYMNRAGGVFTPGAEDSRKDRSSIIPQTGAIEAWDVSQQDWSELMICARAQFAPFAIDVTDVDPGDVPHIESVIGGQASDLGFPGSYGGVSPFTRDCRVIASPIVFTFAAVLPDQPQIVCEVMAQEVAHSLGLDHEFLCEDPMSYLGGCGAKTFQDVDAACGESEARPCRIDGLYDCGRETQNSYQLLASRLGLRGEQPVAPQLSIVAPADGARLAPGFLVTAEASSPRGAVEVELRIDGVTAAVGHAAPYELAAPAAIEAGQHIVELVARDGLAETSESIAVQIESADVPPPGDPGAHDDPAPAVPQCSTGGGAGGGLAGVLLLALVLRSARRTRRSRRPRAPGPRSPSRAGTRAG